MNYSNNYETPAEGVQLLTIREVMARLKCSRSTFYLLNNEFQFIRKIRGASRVRSDTLEAYIASLPHTAEVAK